MYKVEGTTRYRKNLPEFYRKAIELYDKPGDQIVGFEDSVCGWQALTGTTARPILVCSSEHPLLPFALAQGAIHYESFKGIPKSLFLS